MDASNAVERLHQGREKELSELFMRVRSHLRRMIELRLDRRLRSRIDASDIVQEAFVRANQGLDAYLQSPQMDPVVWLRVIGRCVLAETHRKQFRGKRCPDRERIFDYEGEDPLAAQLADSVRSVGSMIALNELVHTVRTRIATLSENDREMLEMRHVEGLTIKEAAEALEITIDTAKKRYARALRRFRASVQEIVP